MPGQDPGVGPYRRARRQAYRLLGRRARTEGELRTVLARTYGAAVVEAVLDSLRDEGSLDDARTAREWLDWRQRRDPLGRVRLEAELRRRGLGREEALAAIQEYYQQHAEADDLSRGLDRMLRGRGTPLTAAEARRLAARLSRRGFSGEAIRGALRRHAVEEEW